MITRTRKHYQTLKYRRESMKERTKKGQRSINVMGQRMLVYIVSILFKETYSGSYFILCSFVDEYELSVITTLKESRKLINNHHRIYCHQNIDLTNPSPQRALLL